MTATCDLICSLRSRLKPRLPGSGGQNFFNYAGESWTKRPRNAPLRGTHTEVFRGIISRIPEVPSSRGLRHSCARMRQLIAMSNIRRIIMHEAARNLHGIRCIPKKIGTCSSAGSRFRGEKVARNQRNFRIQPVHFRVQTTREHRGNRRVRDICKIPRGVGGAKRATPVLSRLPG